MPVCAGYRPRCCGGEERRRKIQTWLHGTSFGRLRFEIAQKDDTKWDRSWLEARVSIWLPLWNKVFCIHSAACFFFLGGVIFCQQTTRLRNGTTTCLGFRARVKKPQTVQSNYPSVDGQSRNSNAIVALQPQAACLRDGTTDEDYTFGCLSMRVTNLQFTQ